MSSRRGRRYDTEAPVRVIGRGVVVLALVGFFIYLAVTLYNGIPLRDYRYVEAAVPNPGSLIPHDPVRIGGVQLGQVSSIGSTAGGEALLNLQLAPGTRVPADTRILIRANGLLGARYVELVLGHSKLQLPAGAIIHGDQNSLTFGVTDALDVLNTQTRGALRVMVNQLAIGVLGQGTHVNDLLRVGGQQVTPATALFQALAAAPAATHRLLSALAAASAPLDANRVQIAQLFGTAAAAVQPFVSQRSATRQTLSDAPGTLASAENGLAAGQHLLAAVRSLSVAIRGTVPPAPAGLVQARALLVEARSPLRQADTLLRAAAPAVPGALRITNAAAPVLGPTTKLLTGSLPIINTLAPYGCDLENFGAVFRSMTGFGSSAPGGPGGPPGEFRLQVASPTGAENLGMADPTGLVKRAGYPTPCEFLSKPYPILFQRATGGGA
ncbi:MAG: MlaD family protein [Solirubrobacteraceae bacterium]